MLINALLPVAFFTRWFFVVVVARMYRTKTHENKKSKCLASNYFTCIVDNFCFALKLLMKNVDGSCMLLFARMHTYSLLAATRNRNVAVELHSIRLYIAVNVI